MAEMEQKDCHKVISLASLLSDYTRHRVLCQVYGSYLLQDLR